MCDALAEHGLVLAVRLLRRALHDWSGDERRADGERGSRAEGVDDGAALRLRA